MPKLNLFSFIAASLCLWSAFFCLLAIFTGEMIFLWTAGWLLAAGAGLTMILLTYVLFRRARSR